ncbi:ABC transporter G family member 2 [Zostera marina]|uniref:ABC transporter G family member 2 n=1 Tax=Zostera marina TaxID=29655 RepID=A0A0K9Q2X7_ZOSMR|nr:ABC transporter G family member 2 [Zostera marina]
MASTSSEPEITSDGRGEMKSPTYVLSFKYLCYSVNSSSTKRDDQQSTTDDGGTVVPRKKRKKKVLLDSISGEARDGEILAVLGASGSGKSTLIDALADRISSKSLRGSITLNGENLSKKQLKAISAYVMQDDLLFPMLTVEETLMFSAEFRLPASLTPTLKRRRVETLIDQLGLRSVAKTIIGDEGHRGISGGERRRVSIGVDIIHDPILLFLDEPTTGLDSTSAFTVVNVLKRIAENGSVVIMSIHQPSHRIFGLFDHLIYLSCGKTVYSGPPNQIGIFLEIFGKPIPIGEIHSEFMLDLIDELESSPQGTTELVRFHSNNNSKQSSSPSKTKSRKSRSSSNEERLRRTTMINGGGSGFANPIWKEMQVIAKRSFTNTLRTPELIAMRFGAVFMIGAVLASIFYNLDDSPNGIKERIGFFAFAVSTVFYSCAEALPMFLQERYIFIRETAYNAYRRSSYVLSTSLAIIPSLLIYSLLFSVTTFFPIGLDGGLTGFFFYYITIFSCFWSGSSFVTFLSGVISNLILGYVVVVALLAYYLLFSGFFITHPRIPDYWIWFHYLSLAKYPYEAILHNEFRRSNKCYIKGFQVFAGSPLGEATPEYLKEVMFGCISGSLHRNVDETTCFSNGLDVLKQHGIGDMSKWYCLLISLSWGIFFRILFYFSLLIGCKNKRK